MNTKARGQRVESYAKEVLEAAGYILEKARPAYRHTSGGIRATAVDMFRAFDFIGKAPGQRTLWLQVKTASSAIGSALAPFREIEGHFDLRFDDVQVWRWHVGPPGKPGWFQVYRWDDDFAFTKGQILKRSDHIFPWDASVAPRDASLEPWTDSRRQP